MSSFWEWLKRGYKAAVMSEMLRQAAAPVAPTTNVAPVPKNIVVKADIPPLAQYGSYEHHKGVNVFIDPPPGKAISTIVAEVWLED